MQPDLLPLRSDDRLLELFRAGSDEAFAVLHDRYRQPLLAYVHRTLSVASRHDAEDVLQDVFLRALVALRRDDRPLNLRAWLFRVARNRCIDHMRRQLRPLSEILEASRTAPTDPADEAQRREDLRCLVRDLARLPGRQRSALLLHEIDGVPYAGVARALHATMPAVKSLLLRARLKLAQEAEAREADCAIIRWDLLDARNRGVKASGRARRHLRECPGCRAYRRAARAANPSVRKGSGLQGAG